VLRRVVEVGLALSKMTAFQCFHHAVSITSDEVPFLIGRKVDWIAVFHHSTKSSSSSGGPDVDRIKDITSYKIVVESGKPHVLLRLVTKRATRWVLEIPSL
jgi:hypothetical protein